MVQIDIVYEGKLRTKATHEPSKQTLSTDAPRDNEGLGETFSPTDLMATALGSCILTTIGIYAKRHQIPFEGATARVEKHMTTDPVRRIGKLIVSIEMPAGVDPKYRLALERAGHACPVHKSLHPDVQAPISFHYPD
jgi:putative redox protein